MEPFSGKKKTKRKTLNEDLILGGMIAFIIIMIIIYMLGCDISNPASPGGDMVIHITDTSYVTRSMEAEWIVYDREQDLLTTSYECVPNLLSKFRTFEVTSDSYLRLVIMERDSNIVEYTIENLKYTTEDDALKWVLDGNEYKYLDFKKRVGRMGID
jgi:hypothetical protein